MTDSPFAIPHEFVLAARKNVSDDVWTYINTGSGTETTVYRNRLALDRLALVPRVLRDVSKIDTSSRFLGHRLRIPVLLAPLGSAQLITPEGGIASARAAADFGTICFTSTATLPDLETIAAATDHPKFFQIYIRGEEEWVRDLIDRVKAAGFSGLALTVDFAYYSRKDRMIAARWMPPTFDRVAANRTAQASITWEKMAAMKAYAGMPFIVKGIQSAEDAALCVEHGVDVVYVSNHGGRQIDHGQGMIDLLPSVVKAVGGKAMIVVDGGIVRGEDVVKAIALGADAVAIGRLQSWALAAGGSEALVRALEILEDEIKVAMGLLGVTSLDELNRSYLAEAPPSPVSSEFSAMPLLPPGFK